MNWDLTKLYSDFDDTRLMEDWRGAEALLSECGDIISSASSGGDASAVALLLARMSAMETLMSKVGGYIQLTLAADSENERALALHGKLMEFFSNETLLLSRFKTYIGGVADIGALIASEPSLEKFRYLLESTKRASEHVIDPVLEPAVRRMQLTGGMSWEQLRDQLEAGHSVDLEIDGKLESLPLPAVRNMATSDDADLRKRAYEAEIASYARVEIPMAACLNGIKGEARYMAELQHYDSVLDWALDAARIDRPTLEALLAAMRESLPMFRRYFKAKAEYMGHKNGLPFYDLFAPLGKSGRKYTLDETKALLMDVMGRFSPRMASMIGRAFDERWIDAYPRKGKQGGAFCAGMHPLGISYVLANFDGLSGVATLAHELGHAYHGECLKENDILLSDYPMPLAETASIFNETLLTGELIARADGDERLMIIEQEVSDAAQVIVDILSRYIFETEVIEKRADHALSPKELNDIMLRAQDETYGDGLDPSYRHQYMWACKSHYYSSGLHFYNFPYAFGLLFGKGVYALYQARGAAFAPEYDELLKRTALGDVADVAASVGIDVRDVNFWRSSLKVVGDSIDRLCELLKEGK